eukprot:m.128591 g.128591  ORF g.128591 m.128591 type:complete len:1537 (+) comp13034_c0_seq1:48-4658(+)
MDDSVVVSDSDDDSEGNVSDALLEDEHTDRNSANESGDGGGWISTQQQPSSSVTSVGSPSKQRRRRRVIKESSSSSSFSRRKTAAQRRAGMYRKNQQVIARSSARNQLLTGVIKSMYTTSNGKRVAVIDFMNGDAQEDVFVKNLKRLEDSKTAKQKKQCISAKITRSTRQGTLSTRKGKESKTAKNDRQAYLTSLFGQESSDEEVISSGRQQTIEVEEARVGESDEHEEMHSPVKSGSREPQTDSRRRGGDVSDEDGDLSVEDTAVLFPKKKPKLSRNQKLALQIKKQREMNEQLQEDQRQRRLRLKEKRAEIKKLSQQQSSQIPSSNKLSSILATRRRLLGMRTPSSSQIEGNPGEELMQLHSHDGPSSSANHTHKKKKNNSSAKELLPPTSNITITTTTATTSNVVPNDDEGDGDKDDVDSSFLEYYRSKHKTIGGVNQKVKKRNVSTSRAKKPRTQRKKNSSLISSAGASTFVSQRGRHVSLKPSSNHTTCTEIGNQKLDNERGLNAMTHLPQDHSTLHPHTKVIHGRDDNSHNVILWEGSRSVNPTLSPSVLTSMWNYMKHKPLSIPKSIGKYLFPYQQDGVKTMASWLKQERGGILADERQLGKRVQVVALVISLVEHSRSIHVNLSTEHQKQGKQRVLIICKTKEKMERWSKEFGVWGKDGSNGESNIGIQVGVFYGKAQEKERVLQSIVANQSSGTGEYDVVLTTTSTFSKDSSSSLGRLAWMMVVLDDALTIKSSSAQLTRKIKSIPTKRRIAVCGKFLKCKCDEMWCILDWVWPNELGTKRDFEEKFISYMKQWKLFDADGQIAMHANTQRQELSLLLQKGVLLRTREEIAKELPSVKNSVLFCQMTKLQEIVHSNLMNQSIVKEYILKRSLECDCSGNKGRSPSARLQRCQCCFEFTNAHKVGVVCTCDLGVMGSLEEKKEKRVNRPTCSVCHCSEGRIAEGRGCVPWYDMVHPTLALMLKAANHIALLLPNIHIDPDQLHKKEEDCGIAFGSRQTYFYSKLGEDRSAALAAPGCCGKVVILLQLLNAWYAEGNNTIVLFVYSRHLLTILQNVLAGNSIECVVIGDHQALSTRREKYGKFRSAPCNKVLVLFQRGEDVDVSFANKFIFYDPSNNPQLDRKTYQRFGIGKHVKAEVVQLITANSVEEKVYAYQVYRQMLLRLPISSSTLSQQDFSLSRTRRRRRRRKRHGEEGRGSGEEVDLFGLDAIFEDEDLKTDHWRFVRHISRGTHRQHIVFDHKGKQGMWVSPSSLHEISDDGVYDEDDDSIADEERDEDEEDELFSNIHTLHGVKFDSFSFRIKNAYIAANKLDPLQHPPCLSQAPSYGGRNWFKTNHIARKMALLTEVCKHIPASSMNDNEKRDLVRRGQHALELEFDFMEKLVGGIDIFSTSNTNNNKNTPANQSRTHESVEALLRNSNVSLMVKLHSNIRHSETDGSSYGDNDDDDDKEKWMPLCNPLNTGNDNSCSGVESLVKVEEAIKFRHFKEMCGWFGCVDLIDFSKQIASMASNEELNELLKTYYKACHGNQL